MADSMNAESPKIYLELESELLMNSNLIRILQDGSNDPVTNEAKVWSQINQNPNEPLRNVAQIHMEILLSISFAPSYPKFKIPKVELEIVIFFFS